MGPRLVPTAKELAATGVNEVDRTVTAYDPRPFIASVEWRFAKTMAHYNPHWYVVERDAGGELFSAFVAFIRDSGRVRRYRGYPYRSVTVDGFDYWLTWADDAGAIINRKPSADAGWDE